MKEEILMSEKQNKHRKNLQKEYLKQLENGYIEIMEIFKTHAYDDVSVIDKIYEIVKVIYPKI